jgi:hypothetical protein
MNVGVPTILGRGAARPPEFVLRAIAGGEVGVGFIPVFGLAAEEVAALPAEVAAGAAALRGVLESVHGLSGQVQSAAAYIHDITARMLSWGFGMSGGRTKVQSDDSSIPASAADDGVDNNNNNNKKEM